MGGGVRDVPFIGADCVQRTGVLSEPVDAGDTAVVTTVSLNGHPLTEMYNTTLWRTYPNKHKPFLTTKVS